MTTTRSGTESPTFAEWLEKHRRGGANRDWTAELADVLEAVSLTGKPGRLTITIDLTPKGRTVLVTDKVSGRRPVADSEASVYFVDRGALVRHDPLQRSLDDHARDSGAERPDDQP